MSGDVILRAALRHGRGRCRIVAKAQSAGQLVGIVSEVDLLHRQELGTARDPFDRPWWVRLFKGEQWPASYVKAHAARVADAMTAPVVTVIEDATLVELARILEKHSVRRVPVLRGHTLVGIVSRSVQT